MLERSAARTLRRLACRKLLQPKVKQGYRVGESGPRLRYYLTPLGREVVRETLDSSEALTIKAIHRSDNVGEQHMTHDLHAGEVLTTLYDDARRQPKRELRSAGRGAREHEVELTVRAANLLGPNQLRTGHKLRAERLLDSYRAGERRPWR